MAIETSENGGFIVTGEADTRLFQVIALKSMLNLEVKNPGMRFSKGSPFKMLKTLGIIPTNVRTKKKGLEYVETYLEKVRKERMQ